MKYLKIHILSFLLVIFWGCSEKKINEPKSKIIPNKYSKNFEVHEINNGYIIKIKDKIGDRDTVLQNYLLTKDEGYESKNDVIIHIPVSKVVCFSTTHCAFISVLSEENSIKGIGGTDYIYNNKIRIMINRNEISEVGYDNRINTEKILSLNPDVVFAFGIDNSGMSGFQKVIDLGVPVVFVQDFKENHPLGRAEWIKFFGCFYDKLDNAQYYFDSLENNYMKLKNTVSQKKQKPRVLVGLPWQGTWWVPGGDSFFANFIKDAGGDYIFSDNNYSESQPKSIEEIFAKSEDVDIWLNPNSFSDKKSMLSVDSRLKEFKAYNNADIYNNNKKISLKGGNDFWESGVVSPDKILSDLITIFNNRDSAKIKNLHYYKFLN